MASTQLGTTAYLGDLLFSMWGDRCDPEGRHTCPDIVGEFKGENWRQPEGIAEVGSSHSSDETCESRWSQGDDNHSFPVFGHMQVR